MLKDRRPQVMSGEQRLHAAFAFCGATAFSVLTVVVGQNWNDANARHEKTQQIEASKCHEDSDDPNCNAVVKKMMEKCDDLGREDRAQGANCMQVVYDKVGEDESP